VSPREVIWIDLDHETRVMRVSYSDHMRVEKQMRSGQIAETWLRDQLRNGPRASAELKRLAHEAGIAPITLQRTATRIGVISTYQGRNTFWWISDL
jgi:hypothetical protein